MTPNPGQVNPLPPARRGRWLRFAAAAGFALAALAFAGSFYRDHRPERLLEQGETAIRNNDADRLRTVVEKLESRGHADHARYLRGQAAQALGSPAAALEQFNAIPSDSPLRSRVAPRSARCLLDLGELLEAHRVFTIVADEQPEHIDAQRGLAAIAFDLGQLEIALAHLNRVAELDPADYRAHRLSGLIYKDMDRNGEAEAAYRECLNRKPARGVEREAKLGLAEVLIRQLRYADALEIAAKLELGPPNEAPNPIALRAESLRGLGRPAEAARELDAVIGRVPTPALHRLRGQTHLDAGETTGAVRNLERAAELNPHDHLTQYLLGQAYTAAGRDPDAAAAFAKNAAIKKTLDLISDLTKEAIAKPWDAAVRLKLAELHAGVGQQKIAEVWRRAAAACAAAK